MKKISLIVMSLMIACGLLSNHGIDVYKRQFRMWRKHLAFPKRQSAGQYPEREESVRQQGKKSWLI